MNDDGSLTGIRWIVPPTFSKAVTAHWAVAGSPPGEVKAQEERRGAVATQLHAVVIDATFGPENTSSTYLLLQLGAEKSLQRPSSAH